MAIIMLSSVSVTFQSGVGFSSRNISDEIPPKSLIISELFKVLYLSSGVRFTILSLNP